MNPAGSVARARTEQSKGRKKKVAAPSSKTETNKTKQTRRKHAPGWRSSCCPGSACGTWPGSSRCRRTCPTSPGTGCPRSNPRIRGHPWALLPARAGLVPGVGVTTRGRGQRGSVGLEYCGGLRGGNVYSLESRRVLVRVQTGCAGILVASSESTGAA